MCLKHRQDMHGEWSLFMHIITNGMPRQRDPGGSCERFSQLRLRAASHQALTGCVGWKPGRRGNGLCKVPGQEKHSCHPTSAVRVAGKRRAPEGEPEAREGQDLQIQTLTLWSGCRSQGCWGSPRSGLCAGQPWAERLQAGVELERLEAV